MEENEQIITEEPTPETIVPITDDLAAVREVVLRAHPDAVPELIAGDSITELLASVEPARAAYARVVAAASPETPTSYVKPVAPVVPAGDAPVFAVDPDQLPPVEKIRRGLAGQRPSSA
jgi:hypothetical protein